MKASEKARFEAAQALKAQIANMGTHKRKAARAAAIVHVAIVVWFGWLTWRTVSLSRRVAELEAKGARP